MSNNIFIEGGEITESAAGQRRDVEVTVIKAGPGNPRNNHYYPAEMLEAATPQFAGAHIYADHPDADSDRKSGGVRSTKDLVGVIRETWWDANEQAIKGRATIARNWVWEIIEADMSLLGLSIRGGAGKLSRRKVAGAIRNIVESIATVKSVDLVTRAGAGGKINRILESMQEDDMALDTITLDDIKEHRSDLIEAMLAENEAAAKVISVEDHEAALAEARTAAADEARTAAIAETEARIAAEREAEDRVRDNVAVVESLVTEAKLPERTSARLKRDFTKTAEGDTSTDDLREALQSAISEAKEELAEAAGSGEIKGMGGKSLEESGSKVGSSAPTKSSTPIHDRVLGAIAPALEA